MDARRPLYNEVATFTIDTNDLTPDEVVGPAHALLGLPHGLKCDAGLPVECLAGLGESDAARGSAQESCAKPLFEASETAAHGRARNSKLGCGTREGLCANRLRESEEL